MTPNIIKSITTNQSYQKELNSSSFRKLDKSLFLSWFRYYAKKHMNGQGKYMNQKNKLILETLFDYFCGNEDFNKHGIVKGNASIQKGLYIYGSVGTGKTTFFDLLKQTGKTLYKKGVKSDLTYRDISCGNFVQLFMRSQKRELNFDLNPYYKHRLYIDDLGVEQLCFNSYELIGDILFERYRNNARTWITTNLDVLEFSKRYGKRLEDRFQEMFNVIEWSHESYRDEL
jgi:DNA replication protein DnaC